MASVQAEPCGVDAEGGEIAADRSCGIAHGHAASGPFIIGLRVEDGIVNTLGMESQG